MKRIVKIVEIGDDYIVFNDGSRLYSDHDTDCYERHWLDFSVLAENKYVSVVDGKSFDIYDREFDFSSGIPFKRVTDMGILLLDTYGDKYLICGHGENNGCYGTDIDLIYCKGKKNIYVEDVTECQDIDWC